MFIECLVNICVLKSDYCKFFPSRVQHSRCRQTIASGHKDASPHPQWYLLYYLPLLPPRSLRYRSIHVLVLFPCFYSYSYNSSFHQSQCQHRFCLLCHQSHLLGCSLLPPTTKPPRNRIAELLLAAFPSVVVIGKQQYQRGPHQWPQECHWSEKGLILVRKCL